jgi:hypothetical protein
MGLIQTDGFQLAAYEGASRLAFYFGTAFIVTKN